MNARDTRCLSLAAALACGVVASDVRADDAATGTPTAARRTSSSLEPARVRRVPGVQRAPAAGATGSARASTLASPSVAPLVPAPLALLAPVTVAPSVARRTPSLERVARELDAGAVAGAERASAASGEGLAPWQRLLDDGGTLGLVQSLIVPAARGVTIAEVQSDDAALTLALRPTQITRGSGLVATGQF